MGNCNVPMCGESGMCDDCRKAAGMPPNGDRWETRLSGIGEPREYHQPATPEIAATFDPKMIASWLAVLEKAKVRDISLPELRRRVVTTITPTINTEDALTLAALVELVTCYVDAIDCAKCVKPHDGENLKRTTPSSRAGNVSACGSRRMLSDTGLRTRGSRTGSPPAPSTRARARAATSRSAFATRCRSHAW